MIKLRSLPLYVPLCVLASTILFPAVSQAQGVAPAVRIVSPIDEAQLVTLSGNTNPQANAKNDRGAVSASFALPDLTLVLSRSADQQAAFDAYVASEYNPNSPNYHQWLTPQQIGAQFGPAQADIATITGWLASHGFTVKLVTPDLMTIRFSGTAGQVESAFHTQIHSLSVNGVGHYANMTDPQIPAALAPVIVGVKALHNFLPQPQHKLGSLVQFDQQTGKWKKVTAAAGSPLTSPPASSAPPSSGTKPALNPHPQFGINGSCGTGCTYLEEDVAPYDFATIYNVTPLWNNNINGSGQTIAIVGTSFINIGLNGGANDVATFRSAFGLSANFPTSPTPHEIDAGPYFNTGTTASICTSTSSSAYCGIGDLEENSLDVEWSGAVAPNAQIDLVVTGQTSACNGVTGAGCIDTLYDAAAYVVDNPATAKIMSVSYGECELGQGTAGNVAFYDLWQQAAAEGISVFVSTGDSGSPSCDDDLDGNYGNPYVAQYGLSVSGIASTPFNTAVGGTDFSWCQPYYNSSGNYVGCASSSTSQSPAYWATSNNGTTGASALGYVPEIPWNDTCENPINARYLETLLSAAGFDSAYGVNPTTPEESCSVVYNDWYTIYRFFELEYGDSINLSPYVDTVGGSGGPSNCVVNDNSTTSSCTTTAGSSTTGSSFGNIPTYNDGWVKPAWQSGITGIPSDGVRDIPDVSFFAGNGNLNTATLICVSNVGACTYSSTTEDTAQEVGGTSVATPQMAGVMALINQKAGGAQGLANPQLYQIASRQTYSSCSSESVSSSSSCYFQDIDYGPTAPNGPSYTTSQTISMPCNLTGTPEGGDEGETIQGFPSPNCTAINSGDTIGTLVSSGTAAWNSGTGFDLATGLGSLNVANVVNAWVSDAGADATTMTVTPTPSTITINQALSVVVSVTGSAGTPTGTITLSGDGYSSTETIGTAPCTSNTSCTFNIPANTLAAGSGITFTAYYNGNATYAANSKTTTITVNVMTPTVGVSAPSSGNVANPTSVTVSITGPSGSTAIPTGTIYLKSGSYTSATETIGVSPCTSAASCSFTIPANSLAVATDTITADYSGDANYAGNTGSTSINVTGSAGSVTATTGSGQSAAVSTAYATPLQATVKDSSGNLLSGVTVTFTAPASGASGTFANGTATTTAVSNSSGVATASTFTANTIVGTVSIIASASGANSATFTLTNTAGAPASVTATAGSGQSAAISTAYTTALQATVKDSSGNLVSGITVTFTAPSSGASGTFANGTATTTAVTNSSGVATASTFTANTIAGTVSIVASATGATSATFTLTNTAGAPSSVTATAGNGQSAAISTAYTTALQATVKDGSGNPIPGVTVTFTAPASGASGTFANSTATTTAVTNSSGVATASTFTANTVAGTVSIIASTTGANSATFTLTNTPGAPASVTASVGSGQSAAISTAYITALQATVKDSGGNLVSGVTVTFTAPASGASGTFANGTATTTAVTNSSGVATASTFTANTIAGTVSVIASATGATSATFTLTNTSTILTPTITVTPSPTSIDSGQSLGVTVSVTGAGTAPTGTVSLKSGSYTSSTETIGTSPCTSNTNCSFTIPANSLSAGSDTITANYSGNSTYAAGSNTGSVSVTESVYTLAASTPASVSPGSSTASTITGTTSSTDYTGTVTLSSACTLTNAPTGAVSLPTCSASGAITYSNGAATGSGTATVYTTAQSTVDLVRPKLPGSKEWLGAGSGTVLALLVFFGVPARRRSWRAMLSILVVLVAIGSLASCGGGGSGGGGGTTTIPGTTAGSYTFTVQGVGNDPASTQESTTFTVTVN
jgi:Fe-S cluster assembly iron-binding protein IscA